MTGTAVNAYELEGVQDYLEMWAEEASEGATLKFKQIVLPGSGGTVWEIPNGTDSPDTTVSIAGPIVSDGIETALYFTAFDDRKAGDSTRPDAISRDGKTQFVFPETYIKIDTLNETRRAEGKPELPYPAARIADCPYSKWPEEGGAGVLLGVTNKPLTSKFRTIYVYLGGSSKLPVKVRIPSTSAKLFESYKAALIDGGLRPSSVITEITLRKAQNTAGTTYSEPVFTLRKDADGNPVRLPNAAQLKEFSREIKGMIHGGASAVNHSLPELEAPAYSVQQIAAPAAPAAPVYEAPVAQAAPADLDAAFAAAGVAAEVDLAGI